MENSPLFNYLWPLVRRHLKSFILIALLWSTNSIYTIIIPYFLKLFINAISNCKDVGNIFFSLQIPLIAFGGFLLFRFIAISSVVKMRARTFSEFRASVRLSLFNHLIDHSANFFAKHFSGTLTNHIVSMPKNAHKIIGAIIEDFFPTALELILGAFFLFQAHYVFAIIFLIWLALHLYLIIKKSSTINNNYTKHAQKLAQLNGKIGDVITNIHNVRLFAAKNFEKAYLEKSQIEEIEEYQKSSIFAERVKGFTSLLGGFFMPLFMVLFLIIFWQKGIITVGDFGLILPLTTRLFSHGWEMGVHFIDFAEEIGSCKEALNIIKQPHELPEISNLPALKTEDGKIEIKNLYFSYGEEVVFENLNLTIKGKEKVGIVGFSGSGKSTFVNLLLRNFDPGSGKILIDRQNIAEVSQKSLHDQISVVPQEIILFHRTLLENIRYGKLLASDEEVLHASKNAHCHEFIEEFPKKYETIAGERGLKLSGGQKQRIAIARAMLKDAPIFIFDEATSSVDPITETKIQESLLYLKNKTVIIVTHRLPILSSLDRIIVFKDGKIVEEGSHSELIKKGTHFSELWEAHLKESLAAAKR